MSLNVYQNLPGRFCEQQNLFYSRDWKQFRLLSTLGLATTPSVLYRILIKQIMFFERFLWGNTQAECYYGICSNFLQGVCDNDQLNAHFFPLIYFNYCFLYMYQPQSDSDETSHTCMKILYMIWYDMI